ncbi:MAG TPA: hypothetical protein VK689_16680, partial [Armatimonadota bacterium]|nr:hypothetical protein [Armatimonadota bacterium]
LRERVYRTGPASPTGRRRDALGMEHFIGKVLALEAAHGPVLVANVLDRIAEPRPQDLERHLETVIGSLRGTPLRLNPEAFVRAESQVEPTMASAAGLRFRKASYWVYLPAGDWQIRVTGSVPASTTASLSGVALGQPAAGEVRTAVWDAPAGTSSGGWRRLEFVVLPGSVLQLDEILLSKRGTPPAER